MGYLFLIYYEGGVWVDVFDYGVFKRVGVGKEWV